MDYESVAAGAMEADVGGQPAPIANLRSIVGFKRLAGRPQDKRDLEELEAFHGRVADRPYPRSGLLSRSVRGADLGIEILSRGASRLGEVLAG